MAREPKNMTDDQFHKLKNGMFVSMFIESGGGRICEFCYHCAGELRGNENEFAPTWHTNLVTKQRQPAGPTKS